MNICRIAPALSSAGRSGNGILQQLPGTGTVRSGDGGPDLRRLVSRIEERIAAAPVVCANEGQLQQVLTNLVTNAAHAIGAEMGTIGIELTVDPLPRDGSADSAALARLSVTDSGPGMTETTLRRLFEPFYTTKAVGEGTGLGLAVVHGIVASHGGRVEVTSQLGKGTRFDVLLPAISGASLSRGT
jgi:two-component system, cell cycle sensor histidine kinase and response regulator CckA